jgi:hypothetical protein
MIYHFGASAVVCIYTYTHSHTDPDDHFSSDTAGVCMAYGYAYTSLFCYGGQ